MGSQIHNSPRGPWEYKTGLSHLQKLTGRNPKQLQHELDALVYRNPGLLVRRYQGAQALPVCKVDTDLLSLVSELRAPERQAAEESGQWREKRDLTANGLFGTRAKRLFGFGAVDPQRRMLAGGRWRRSKLLWPRLPVQGLGAGR
jgi:hypothetical protein